MIIRFYTEVTLGPKTIIELSAKQTHYIDAVMRRNKSDKILFFNGKDGEWVGYLETTCSPSWTVRINSMIRSQLLEPDIALAFAPVKKARTDFIIEKATELGVSKFMPIITQRTMSNRVNLIRMRSTAQKAAEQSERLTLPIIFSPITLINFLQQWPDTKPIFFLNEAGSGNPIFNELFNHKLPIGILTGPEGGFSQSEISTLRSFPFVKPITLGPRVLKSETAALSAIACFQAALGDWRTRTRMNIAKRTNPQNKEN